MEPQTILNIAIGLAGGFGGFILRATWQATETMRKDLQALQSSISDTYMRRDDFKDDLNEIRSMFKRIDEKLDRKVDR